MSHKKIATIKLIQTKLIVCFGLVFIFKYNQTKLYIFTDQMMFSFKTKWNRTVNTRTTKYLYVNDCVCSFIFNKCCWWWISSESIYFLLFVPWTIEYVTTIPSSDAIDWLIVPPFFSLRKFILILMRKQFLSDTLGRGRNPHMRPVAVAKL